MLTEKLELTPLVPMFAYAKFWDVFRPEDGGPPIEIKAGWLADFLLAWSWEVHSILTIAGTGGPEPQVVRSLLEALGHAAEAMLAFKKRDHPIEIPEWFAMNAQALLVEADRHGVRTDGLTIPQIGMRLAAAKSRLGSTTSRRISTDDDGRVFDESGERLFEFDPEKIFRGKRQVAAGQTYPLREIREAEGRNGH